MTSTESRLAASGEKNGVAAGGRHRSPASGTPMAPEAMADYFAERLEDRLVSADIAFGQLTLTVTPDALHSTARLCKSDPRLDFDFWEFQSGVDLREEGFAVVTHLYSIYHGHHVQLRVVAEGGREAPRLPSLTDVYRGANWSERETYDMFGIDFEGHPGLLPRLLTVENFEGWPLRKEFLLSTREVKPWPGLKEPKDPGEDREVAVDGDAAAAPPRGMDAEAKAAAAKEKAERAKRKAAEMRAKKAKERAEAMGQTETAPTADGVAPEESDAGDFADSLGNQSVTNEAARESGGERPGAPAQPDAAPGMEAEGRHTGADEQTGRKPAAETPGMTSPTQDAEAGRPVSTTPAPGPDSNVAAPEEAGSDDLPPGDESPHEDEEGQKE